MDRLLYIASVGYSGSTLLEILLSMHSDVTSLGEVALLSRYTQKNGRCTCGQRISDCNFWKTVENELKEELHNQSFSLPDFPLIGKQRRQSTHRLIPSLIDFLLVLGNGRLWEAAARLSHTVRQYRVATANAITLFETVSRLQDTPLIVNSSKYPLPLKSLYLAAPDRVKVIYLVRDGRAVSCSLMKQQNLTMKQAAKRWVRFNWNLRLVMNTISKNKIFRLHYEDLCTDTENALAAVLKFAGAASPLTVVRMEKEKLHTIGGNPMRFRRNERKVVLDEEWKSALSDEDLEIFRRIAGGHNKRLGYSE